MSIESLQHPEQPIGSMEKKAFTELMIKTTEAKGYTLLSENDKEKIFEKSGQILKLVYNFNQSGYISGIAYFEYKDTPLIKTSAISFGHQKELTERDVKKTFDELLKKYETQYDKYLPKFEEIKLFNDQLLLLGQEAGYKTVKSTFGRLKLENDTMLVKLQHLPHKIDDADMIRTTMLEIQNKETGAIDYSAFRWDESTLTETVQEQIQKMTMSNTAEQSPASEPAENPAVQEKEADRINELSAEIKNMLNK